jgi:hypothetical protein
MKKKLHSSYRGISLAQCNELLREIKPGIPVACDVFLRISSGEHVAEAQADGFLVLAVCGAPTKASAVRILYAALKRFHKETR